MDEEIRTLGGWKTGSMAIDEKINTIERKGRRRCKNRAIYLENKT